MFFKHPFESSLERKIHSFQRATMVLAFLIGPCCGREDGTCAAGHLDPLNKSQLKFACLRWHSDKMPFISPLTSLNI